jgi:hypothetical protein
MAHGIPAALCRAVGWRRPKCTVQALGARRRPRYQVGAQERIRFTDVLGAVLVLDLGSRVSRESRPRGSTARTGLEHWSEGEDQAERGAPETARQKGRAPEGGRRGHASLRGKSRARGESRASALGCPATGAGRPKRPLRNARLPAAASCIPRRPCSRCAQGASRPAASMPQGSDGKPVSVVVDYDWCGIRTHLARSRLRAVAPAPGRQRGLPPSGPYAADRPIPRMVRGECELFPRQSCA